ncbi:hypothetical protein J7E62_04385 [Variovorax paradoxus]|nr:hypothetical protein [Variovorax paradoxus]
MNDAGLWAGQERQLNVIIEMTADALNFFDPIFGNSILEFRVIGLFPEISLHFKDAG